MSLLSDLAKYIATVIAIDAIAVAVFLAAGGINSSPTATERGLYILAINILLVGLPIGGIYLLFERPAALRRKLEVSRKLNREKGITGSSHSSAKARGRTWGKLVKEK